MASVSGGLIRWKDHGLDVMKISTKVSKQTGDVICLYNCAYSICSVKLNGVAMFDHFRGQSVFKCVTVVDYFIILSYDRCKDWD